MKGLAFLFSLLFLAGCSVRLSVKEAAFSGELLTGVEDAIAGIENEPSAIPTPVPPAAPVVVQP